MFTRIFYKAVGFSAGGQRVLHSNKRESLKCNDLPSACQQFIDLLKAQKLEQCPMVTEKALGGAHSSDQCLLETGS